MPILSRPADGFVRLILDGDFTAGELERVGASGLEPLGLQERPALMLDCSGAAGLERKDPADLDRMAAFLVAFMGPEARIAILAPANPAFERVKGMSETARNHGVQAQAFRTRAEAEGWLTE